MTEALIPITYKLGIKRDGSLFQSEYCSDGQWIRFNQGKIKKIKGMRSPGLLEGIKDNTTILLLPDPEQKGKIVSYIASKEKIVRTVSDIDFKNYIAGETTTTDSPNTKNTALWQIETIIDDGVQKIVFLSTDNLENIAQTTEEIKLYVIDYSKSNIAELIAQPIQYTDNTTINLKDAGLTGGMIYTAPFLFLYGNAGKVIYSQAKNPFEFKQTKAETISNDKIIYGKAIRGGSNSPTVLFWSLSKVVRLTNVADSNATEPLFQIDVLTNSSSILSSRCVVEYDGLFFWLGTDRLFTYNGVVQEMANNMNINYFFDNLDINHRQKIFGIKNPQYGEIWWFYPEKVGAPKRTSTEIIPEGENTRALIYNKRENAWYDTAISRNTGMFSPDFGFVATFGRSLSAKDDTNHYLWKHETDINEVITGSNTDNKINSFVTTPIISTSAIASQDNNISNDQFIDLKRIEPDFVMQDKDGKDDDNAVINVTAHSRRYAQSSNIISTNTMAITRTTEKIDTRIQGRYFNFTFSSGDNFEFGNIRLLMSEGDGN